MNEGLASLLLPAILVVLIAFMFWSQRRRQNAIGQLQSSLAVGDDVCTTSGLFGTITALDDVTATLRVAPQTQVRFDRRAIAIKVDPTGRPLGEGTGDSAPLTTDAPRPDTEK